MSEEKVVDLLNQESVSIGTIKVYTDDNGEKYQLGKMERKAYINSINGRKQLLEEQPKYVVNSVLSIWGDEPILDDIENIEEEYN